MVPATHRTGAHSSDRSQALIEKLWFMLLLGTLVPSTYYMLRALIGLVTASASRF